MPPIEARAATGSKDKASLEQTRYAVAHNSLRGSVPQHAQVRGVDVTDGMELT